MKWKEEAIKTLRASYVGKDAPDDSLLNCFVCGLNPALLEQEMKRIHDEAKESGRKEMLEECVAHVKECYNDWMKNEEDVGMSNGAYLIWFYLNNKIRSSLSKEEELLNKPSK